MINVRIAIYPIGNYDPPNHTSESPLGQVGSYGIHCARGVGRYRGPSRVAVAPSASPCQGSVGGVAKYSRAQPGRAASKIVPGGQ